MFSEILEPRAITALAVLILAVPVGLAFRAIVLGRLKRLAGGTRWRFDDVLVESLRRPLPWWFAIGGTFLATRLASPPPGWISVIDRGLLAAVVVTITVWLADLTARSLRMASAGQSPESGAITPPVTGVVVNVARIVVFGLGALMLLSSLGISVAPILTTIGVGGIAVALGLQDTLANLFAGVHITLAGNLRVGDYVRLENGDEGYIDDIKWRATRVRTLPGNIVVIPNGRLAQSIVTNYHLPARDLAVLVQMGVHYSSDLPKVERVIVEVASEVLETWNGAPDFTPFVRFHTFGESSIDLTVILRAREFVDQYLIKHEFVKALSARFAAENIVIPFPIRAINLEQEGAAPALARGAPAV